jgi:hypothetical protein
MALPPPWLAIHAALEATLHGPEYQVVSAKQRAQDVVEHFEAMGWRLVPAYAVDESKIGEGLKFNEWFRAALEAQSAVGPEYDVEAGLKRLFAGIEIVNDDPSMTVEEFDAQMNKDRNEWCPECETSPGKCPPGTCPGRIGPQIKEPE